jgi:hypothetical protein
VRVDEVGVLQVLCFLSLFYPFFQVTGPEPPVSALVQEQEDLLNCEVLVIN